MAGESVMRGAHVFAPGLLAVSPGEQGGLGCQCQCSGVCQRLGLQAAGFLTRASSHLSSQPHSSFPPVQLPNYFPLFLLPAGLMQGDLVAVSVGVELPGSERYAFTRGTVLGSGGRGDGGLRV